MIDLSKASAILADENGKLDTITMELSWEQPEAKGFLARAKRAARLDGVDIDANVLLFSGGEAVDYVGPEHLSALSGRLRHHGDVKRGSGEGAGERVTLELEAIRGRDADITDMVITASCKTGDFSQIASAVARFYRGSEVDDAFQIGVVRFPVLGGHTGMILARLTSTPEGWRYVKISQKVQARSWRDLAAAAIGCQR